MKKKKVVKSRNAKKATKPARKQLTVKFSEGQWKFLARNAKAAGVKPYTYVKYSVV